MLDYQVKVAQFYNIIALSDRLLDHFTQRQTTYYLRRLRLHGLIERIPDTHRYQVTEFGWRVAFFFTRIYSRIIRPRLAQVVSNALPLDGSLQRRFNQIETAIQDWIAQANLTMKLDSFTSSFLP